MLGKLTSHHQNGSYDDFTRRWFSQLDRGINKRKKQEDR